MSKASQIRQKAQEFLSKGQTEKAIQEYRRLISIESRNPNLYNELGDIYLRSNDKSQAVQNFEKAAVIYEKVALYNNAVAVCKKILRIEPEKAETIFKLGELRAKQKLTGEAVTYFTQYVEAVLENPQAMLTRSQKDVDLMVGLMPTSEPVLAKAAEIYEQLGLKLRTAEVYTTLAGIASENGDEKNTAHYKRKVDEMKGGLAPEELEQMNRMAAGQGGAASSAIAGEAPVDEPGPAPAAAEPEGAAGNSEAAPDVPPAGDESAAGAGDEERAPADAEAPETGAIASEAIDEAEMVAAMSRGREIYTASEAAVPPAFASGPPAPSREDAAPRVEGDAERGTNLAEEITSDVEKDDLKSHYDLGMAYLEMGLFTEAIRDFQIASRSPELQLSSMEMIGHCFLKHGQPRLAVKQLSHALEIARAAGAECLGIHYNLGLAHEMLDELDAALEHFEEVYVLDMSFRDVADKMKKLTTVS
ncbi:MAG: tetratricopeptide repeat protein [Candidatus Krumholzibacteriaceae bacterium]